jgi:hypothetical protein
MMSNVEVRARAATALLALASGEDVLAFNKNQRRGPDGKWIKGGGIGGGGNGGDGGAGGSAVKGASPEANAAADRGAELLEQWNGFEVEGPANASERPAWNAQVLDDLLQMLDDAESDGVEDEFPDLLRAAQEVIDDLSKQIR